jgi:hypothetical protein
MSVTASLPGARRSVARTAAGGSRPGSTRSGAAGRQERPASALNTTAKLCVIPFSPDAFIERATRTRPEAVLSSDERVAECAGPASTRRSPSGPPGGPARSSTTPRPAGSTFYHLVTFRGLRRGEAVGLPRAEVDLSGLSLRVSEQIVQLGYRTETGSPDAASTRRSRQQGRHRHTARAHAAGHSAGRLAWGSPRSSAGGRSPAGGVAAGRGRDAEHHANRFPGHPWLGGRDSYPSTLDDNILIGAAATAAEQMLFLRQVHPVTVELSQLGLKSAAIGAAK